jgi:aspartate/methionine/tyrosine aminotransferase
MSQPRLPIQPFKLERYFAEYEFKVKYLLSPSDCEALTLAEMLEWAIPEGLKMWQDMAFGYTESQGHPRLREEIARLYSSISPEQVMVAVPEEAIYIAMQTLLKPGDHVVALFPAYQSLYEVARSLGCQLSLWRLQPGEGRWRLDLDELERSLKPNTRLLVINFPHNPTGYLPPQTELEAILEIARAHDLYVFSDEMYRLLEYDPSERLPSVCDRYDKGTSLSGLSKAFALPGLRTGWLCSKSDELMEAWLTFKDYTTICNSAPSEILGILALGSKERILERNLGIIQRNLETAGQFMARHAQCFEWLPPQAGSVAFPRWLGVGSAQDFCREVLDQQGVMIVPGSIFDYLGEHFRVGLGRVNFGEALERVGEYLMRSGAWGISDKIFSEDE